ncbi:MAG: PPC domain-containing protein, partial [Planctomycetes bacterium]|nr:PPC domain-containing protein [Planctomycetota bacterium]
MIRRREVKRRAMLAFESLEARRMLAADTIATAELIPLVSGVESTVMGEISPGGEVDIYVISLGAGDSVTIETVAFDPPANTLDTLLRLFDAQGTELVRNDDFDAGVSRDSRITFDATVDGTFFVGVSGAINQFYNPNVAGSGFGPLMGTYDLNVLLTAAPPTGDGNDTLATADSIDFVFDVTSTISGAIDPGGDVDLFSLQLSAGETVTVDTDAFSPPGNTLDTLLRIFDAAGNEIARNDDDAGTAPDSQVTFVAPADGVFFVGVSGAINQFYNPNVEGSGFGPLRGAFDLNVLVGAAPPIPDGNDTLATAQNVAFTPEVLSTITGTIDPAGDVDMFRLEVDAGDTLFLDFDAFT